MSNLSGKTALVTGASRGIGRASALAQAQAGAHYDADSAGRANARTIEFFKAHLI